MVAVTQWERVNEFHFVRLAIEAASCQEYTENDLVLLSKEKVRLIFFGLPFEPCLDFLSFYLFESFILLRV